MSIDNEENYRNNKDVSAYKLNIEKIRNLENQTTILNVYRRLNRYEIAKVDD